MRLIFDCETNGFLAVTDRMHCLPIRDADTRETWRFRCNKTENTIEEGVRMLHEADEIIGHNIIRFDVPAIKKLYPWFEPKGKITDTLVLSRIIAPDIKHQDFVRVRKGLMPAKLTGKHSLKAWGYRFGLLKGDYDDMMRAKGLDPWAEWNQDMDDYSLTDIDITEVLFHGCEKDMPTPDAVDLEHDIHALAGRMEDNGFPFDVEGAKALAAKLRAEYDELHVDAEQAYGFWFAPKAKWQIGPDWEVPEHIKRKQDKPRLYHKPRAIFGEDNSRSFWADVKVPKRSTKSNDPAKPERDVDAPYCPIKRVDFNPGSRHNIIDRFVTVHGWQPSEFTDAGNPTVDDTVLRAMGDAIPLAKPLAELFFMQKLLGMIENGAGSWLKKVGPDGYIHPVTDTGGTVTRRCSHSHPNIAQVPKVQIAKGKGILFGREGEYGYECRKLFYVPEGWKQVGVDLSGIELRCLAALCAEFDGGELIEVVLRGDPHQYNMDKTGVESRDIAKRLLYALMYGAGDWKLGFTAYPLLPRDQQIIIGKRLRAQFMSGLPALSKAIEKIKKEAEKGYITALDGGKLKIRAVYSSLNTKLQSDAALIAKRWAVFTEMLAQDAGLGHGPDRDFAMMAFIHDELQNRVRDEGDMPEFFGSICIQAAAQAGESFNLPIRIDAEAKYGYNWADTH